MCFCVRVGTRDIRLLELLYGMQDVLMPKFTPALQSSCDFQYDQRRLVDGVLHFCRLTPHRYVVHIRIKSIYLNSPPLKKKPKHRWISHDFLIIYIYIYKYCIIIKRLL